jgi:hypothetical protein
MDTVAYMAGRRWRVHATGPSSSYRDCAGVVGPRWGTGRRMDQQQVGGLGRMVWHATFLSLVVAGGVKTLRVQLHVKIAKTC